jgi:hypothetical protein
LRLPSLPEGELSEPELAVINREIANVFRRWLFDKAQAELQQAIISVGLVPLEAFGNVASLLCTDADFEPLGFLVLQQGLRFGQATGNTNSAGYAVLLRDMGTCLSKQGQHQQAWSHYLASRCIFETGQMFTSPQYAELLTCISQNAMAAASIPGKDPATSSIIGNRMPESKEKLASVTTSSFGMGPFAPSPTPSCAPQKSQDVSILQEPLNDLKSAFICIPSCQCNTTQADLTGIDLQREDSVVLAQVLPVLPLPKEPRSKEELYCHSDERRELTFPATELMDFGEPKAGVVDFGELMRERSQAADRRHRLNHPSVDYGDLEEPADVGLFDMLGQWVSKIGFPWNGAGGHRDGGIPALLQGCRNRPVTGEEEWI